MDSMWAYVASWKRKIKGGFERLIWHSINLQLGVRMENFLEEMRGVTLERKEYLEMYLYLCLILMENG